MKRRILILSLILAMVLTSFTGCKLFNKTDANEKETANATMSAKADVENAEESIPEETIDEFNITPNVKTSNEQTSEVVSETNTSNKKTNTPNTQNKSAATSAKAGIASTNTVASTNTAANTNTAQVNTQPVAKTDKERLRDGEYPLAPVYVNAAADHLKAPVVGYWYNYGWKGPVWFSNEDCRVVQAATEQELHDKAAQMRLDYANEHGYDPVSCGYPAGCDDYGEAPCDELGVNYNAPVVVNEYTVYPDGHIEYGNGRECTGVWDSCYMHLTNVHYPGL